MLPALLRAEQRLTDELIRGDRLPPGKRGIRRKRRAEIIRFGEGDRMILPLIRRGADHGKIQKPLVELLRDLLRVAAGDMIQQVRIRLFHLPDLAAHSGGEPLQAVGMVHGIGNPGDHICSEGALLVPGAAGSEFFSRYEIKKADIFRHKCTEITSIYNYLEKKILNVATDFLNLENHMKEIGSAFNKLATALSFNEHAKKMEGIYQKLNKIFTSWSNSYGKQYTFFKSDFRDFFHYLNLEVQEINTLNQSFIAYKKEYEDISTKLNKRKEELYSQKDQSKWGVEPGTEDQISKYVNNKKKKKKKMLYKETELQNNEKKLVACTLYLMNKQFDKLMKCQSDDVFNYFAKMKEDNQTIAGDAFNLIKLLSVEKEEK